MHELEAADPIPGTTLTEGGAKSFEDELCALINKHSMDNHCHTPDFILAEFMTNCAIHLGCAIARREEWFGRSTSPATVGVGNPESN